MHHVLDQRLSDWKLPPSAWQSLPAQRSKLAAAALLEELDALTQKMIGRALDESFVHAFRWSWQREQRLPWPARSSRWSLSTK
jgi:hypothetical protein